MSRELEDIEKTKLLKVSLMDYLCIGGLSIKILIEPISTEWRDYAAARR